MNKSEDIKASDILRRKKPELQKILIQIEVIDEKGKATSGHIEEEWLASISVDEVLVKVMEAIKEIE
ncbi:hypothetical protein KAT51_08100 [bacterium]|nr:hypothetical protein [bacterium]